MRTVTRALIALLLLPMPAFAESDEAPELFFRMERYYVSYYLNDDGSNTRTYERAMTVLKERAVEGAKQFSVSYSTSVEKADVIEAYTRKANGRRIDSDKSSFQITVNTGKDKNAPAFSDRTTLSVVFPEVTVGDTTVVAYKITQTEPIFPGHVSYMEVFPKVLAYDDVRITIDAPVSLQAQREAREMKEKLHKVKNGRQLIEWTFRNKNPIKSKRQNYTVYDPEKEPGYVYSTFKAYSEVAEAYGVRASPKAEVTERVRKLADKITRKAMKEPREQARALYDWVATNISYAGNCIGVGAVVPRDLSFVLDNRMGDCKDHATLLQALLAAKGISSTQALVNAGNLHHLPRIPVVSSVNHVINYIPSLDLFLDSTSQTTPFGMLPFAVVGKPVLLVDGFQEGLRTPVPPIGSNQQYLKSVLEIKPDGSATGNIEIALKGQYAADVRAWMRNMAKEQEDELVRNILQNAGFVGSGKIKKEDPKPLLDTYKFSVKLEMKEFIRRPGSGAFNIYPLVTGAAPIQSYVWGGIEMEEIVDVACGSGLSVEEYTYRLPKDIDVISIPDNLEVSNDFLSYKASYAHDGNALEFKRAFDDRTSGSVCSPALMSAYKEFSLKVMPNLKAQLLYK